MKPIKNIVIALLAFVLMTLLLATIDSVADNKCQTWGYAGGGLSLWPPKVKCFKL